MGRSKLTVLVAVAAVAALPGRAHAQSAEDKAAADAAFEEGKRLMVAHAFAEACPKFAESLKREPGIGAMLGLADCYEKNGQTASAWAEFREAASAAARKRDPREAMARDNAARLESGLSKILVRVPPAADVQGLVVKRDGIVLGRALWEEAVPVDPGTHTISASAPASKDWQTTVEAPRAPGVQTLTVPRLEPAPISEPAPVPAPILAPPPSDRGRTQRIVGGALAGAGVVSLAIGAVFGAVAKSKLDQSNSGNHCDASDACDETGLTLRQNAESAATGSTVAFVIAGVAVAGGAVLWFTAPGDGSSPANAAAPPRTAHVGLAPLGRGFALVGEW
jgi:serine/threonine-protein kinase